MKHSIRFASALSVAASLLLMASVGRSADSAPSTPPAKATGTAVVSGKVTDSTGKAAPGVKVSLIAGDAAKPQRAAKDPNAKGKGKGGPMPAALATTTTDSDGAYKFDALPAGSYTVMAMGKGVGHGTGHVTLADGQTATADIQLAMGKKAGAKAN